MLREMRLERGWTQEQLAELAGLSVRSIQRIERGMAASIETRNALAAVFGIESSLLRACELHAPGGSKDAETLPPCTRTGGRRDFATHALIFACAVALVLAATGFGDAGVAGFLFGWGLGLIVHGLIAWGRIDLFDAGFARQAIEARLGRPVSASPRPANPRPWFASIPLPTLDFWRLTMTFHSRTLAAASTMVGLCLALWLAHDAGSLQQAMGLSAAMDEASIALLGLLLSAALIAVGVRVGWATRRCDAMQEPEASSAA